MNLADAGLGVIRLTHDADCRGDQLVQLGDCRLYAGADVRSESRVVLGLAQGRSRAAHWL